jgi:hypothetical protein
MKDVHRHADNGVVRVRVLRSWAVRPVRVITRVVVVSVVTGENIRREAPIFAPHGAARCLVRVWATSARIVGVPDVLHAVTARVWALVAEETVFGVVSRAHVCGPTIPRWRINMASNACLLLQLRFIIGRVIEYSVQTNELLRLKSGQTLRGCV